MRVIHKEGPLCVHKPYELKNYNRIVHFAEQSKSLYVWVERDLEGKRERSANILVVGTGGAYEPYWKHISSVSHSGGTVWHLLEEIDPLLEVAKSFLGN